MASGTVRVACVDGKAFTPRDFPEELVAMIGTLPALIARQAKGDVEIPWT